MALMVRLKDNLADKALKHRIGYYFIQVASSQQPLARCPFLLFKLSVQAIRFIYLAIWLNNISCPLFLGLSFRQSDRESIRFVQLKKCFQTLLVWPKGMFH